MTPVEQLRKKLPDCYPNLCSHYAELVARSGPPATDNDAFLAWQRWLASEGGQPVRPLVIDESPEFRMFHARAAQAIREVAKG